MIAFDFINRHSAAQVVSVHKSEMLTSQDRSNIQQWADEFSLGILL